MALKVTDKKDENQSCDLGKEIPKRIAKWKQFARVLDLPDYEIRKLEEDFNNSTERAYNAMKIFCYPNEINNEWKFWKNYLEQFSNGREVIQEMETTFLQLFIECQDSFSHSSIRSGNGLYFHQHDFSNKQAFLPFDGTKEIKVNVGGNNTEIVHYQNYEEFIQTRMRYSNTYNILQDMKTFDFTQNYDAPCNILKSIQTFLEETNDNGFAIKGYSFQNQYKLFGKEIYPEESANNKIFAYFANHNVLLHVKICDSVDSLPKLLNSFPKEVQFAESVHECLHKSATIHIGIVLIDYKDEKYKQFCKQCVSNYLLLPKCIFTSLETFKCWFRKMTSENKNFSMIKDSLKESEKVVECLPLVLKNSIICFMALKKNVFLPTYSSDQGEKLKQLDKLVLLNAYQLNILHSPHRHILIRGGYGTGKSMMLQIRLQQILNQSGIYDVFYYLCHDQMSKYEKQLKVFALDNPDKNILVCNIGAEQGAEFSLSKTLDIIKNSWYGRNVHLFLDEFKGISLSVSEVSSIKEQLRSFKDSHIVIAAQSMEFEEILDDIDGNSSHGENFFQYEALVKETSFEMYQLEYGLRCSKEIHDFISASVDILEDSYVDCPKHSSHQQTYVDRELHLQVVNDFFQDESRELEHYRNKYSFNKPKASGHNISCGKVSLFFTNNKLLFTYKVANIDSKAFMCISPNLFSFAEIKCSLMIFHHLWYMLKEKKEKFVVATSHSHIYNHLHHFLSQNEYEGWTSDVSLFMNNDSSFDVLLTDQGSFRGFEFQNVIFIFHLEKFLQFRTIECFSRATKNLFLILTTSVHGLQARLLDCWKSFNCVDYKELCCDEEQRHWWFKRSNGEIENLDKIHQFPKYSKNEEVTFLYPWTDSSLRLKMPLPKALRDDLGYLGCRKILFLNDNKKLFKEWMCNQKFSLQVSEHLLHEAAVFDALEIFKMLEEQLANDVSKLQLYDRLTLLHVTAVSGSLKVTQYLTSKGSSVNSKDGKGITPLHYTAWRNYSKITEVLLNCQCLVNVIDNKKRTPLHHASQSGSFDVARMIIKHGADVNASDNVAKSPLHYAAESKANNVVPILLQNGALINQKCKLGKTPLHYAAEKDGNIVASFLISKGADINSIDRYKKTPLFYAVKKKNAQLVIMLLESKAKINLVDCKNKTAMDYASQQPDSTIINIFKLYEAILE